MGLCPLCVRFLKLWPPPLAPILKSWNRPCMELSSHLRWCHLCPWHTRKKLVQETWTRNLCRRVFRICELLIINPCLFKYLSIAFVLRLANVIILHCNKFSCKFMQVLVLDRTAFCSVQETRIRKKTCARKHVRRASFLYEFLGRVSWVLDCAVLRLWLPRVPWTCLYVYACTHN